MCARRLPAGWVSASVRNPTPKCAADLLGYGLRPNPLYEANLCLLCAGLRSARFEFFEQRFKCGDAQECDFPTQPSQTDDDVHEREDLRDDEDCEPQEPGGHNAHSAVSCSSVPS